MRIKLLLFELKIIAIVTSKYIKHSLNKGFLTYNNFNSNCIIKYFNCTVL